MSEMVVSGGGASELESARVELEGWRADPSKGRQIPASVWEKAVHAARADGIHTVSRVLGLSYSDLKSHMAGGPRRRTGRPGGAVSFVEVTPAPAASAESSSCMIELSKAGGTRLCISLKSAAAVDWCRIREAFLGA